MHNGHRSRAAHSPAGVRWRGSYLVNWVIPFRNQAELRYRDMGKLRLQKWFTPVTDREKRKVIRDMMALVLARQPRSCNFLQWRDLKVVYKRYRNTRRHRRSVWRAGRETQAFKSRDD
ncbi:AP-1 complex subunit sigma-2 [Liparis tanakae]|uniref:AP-1 complex subunit sigma-2 n=1 Tax=Liparis tanakae TaxID=230148 RepID=A0A4Z2EFV6_9TELE|nr:AP-1 complex subunit sigma-2 [Liparis tanakae]